MFEYFITIANSRYYNIKSINVNVSFVIKQANSNRQIEANIIVISNTINNFKIYISFVKYNDVKEQYNLETLLNIKINKNNNSYILNKDYKAIKLQVIFKIANILYFNL